MDKTYRWIVAGVFAVLSFLMLNRPVTFPAFKPESQANFELISIEQREVLLSAISRLEKRVEFSGTVAKLTMAIQKESVEVLISNTINEDKINLKEGLGIVFPGKFFEADPIAQELALSHWFEDIAQLNWGSDFYLARVHKIKKSN